MATVPVYCVCRLPYDVTRFMIECDACKDWFHGSCVGVEEEEAPDIDIYHCPNCEKTHGKSTLKKKRTWHKHGPGQTPDVKAAKNSVDLDDYEEQDHLDACFKDSDYVYPSLESDEDSPVFKSRSKKRKASDDAPYSPTARVGPSVPRQDRPVREGTRVASIETGLAAAAAKLSQQEEQKSRKKKNSKRKLAPNSTSPSASASTTSASTTSANTTSASTTSASTTPASTTPASTTPASTSTASTSTASTSTASSQASQEGSSPEPPSEAHSSSLADHEYTVAGAFAGTQAGRASQPMAPGVFLTQRRPSASSPNNTAAKGKRTKKGMATAKQRLGKILKIHRNGKLLL
ncbi:PHD finger protein 2 [Rhinolophus ferrumequinum]|uniref:PHD finger protein 2 n=1 Tax=Rhinolophus ferrumequinum TaxID=59479 RepID=A0A7J7VRK6_RHIFE|nr:PHD finger protein 2 [Rhinolophus ferrumequinum]